MPAPQLLAPAAEEGITGDNERAGMQFDEGCEGASISLSVPASGYRLQPLRASRFLCTSR